MRSALLVKFGAIGDVVMLLPAAYRMHLEGYRIDWVCGRAVLPLLELYPWVHPMVVDDGALLRGGAAGRLRAVVGLWRRLAGRRYDVAATLYYDPRYRVMTLPVRAGRKFMLSRTDRRFRLLPGRHHTDEYARLLLGWADDRRPLPLEPLRPEALPASPLARTAKRRVVMAAGGAKNMLADDALRRWPVESYVALAGLLIAQGVEVVLIGGPDDGWVGESFAGVGVTDLIGKLALPQTVALLDEGEVLVTHDTGPLHLGGMTRVGIVTLFGPVDPRGRLPQRAGALALWGGEGFACRPCYDGHTYAACAQNDCIRQWTPGMVAEEVLGMLEERGRGEIRPPRVKSAGSTVGLVRLSEVARG